MVHTQERPFNCHICNKAFNHKISLMNHMYVHTGEKPFRCNLCLRYFASKSNLTRHKATSHSSL
ncbi:hypothetical protein X975_17533, partial [Stegodyphus mimosarum]